MNSTHRTTMSVIGNETREFTSFDVADEKGRVIGERLSDSRKAAEKKNRF